MIALPLFFLLSTVLPTSGCDDDPDRLVAEAEVALADSSTTPDALALARDLVRRARLKAPSLFLTLRLADLAEAAGDEDERDRLLGVAAGEAGEILSPSDRLALARRAEARDDRKGAMLQYGHVLTALARRSLPAPGWIGERIRRLDAEEQAGRLPRRGSFRPPTPTAQRAFAEAKNALTRRKMEAARDGFRRALRLSPGYVEAALALGALEAREGNTAEALAAYRTALAADPDGFEAVYSLANLLWAEPDRQAKQESLSLLDRAISLRPELTRLLREAAERWAAWGDPARALERLEAYRGKAGEAERKETEPLRRRLTAAFAASRSPRSTPEIPEIASPALETYSLAQVYAGKGDAASLAAALDLLSRAARLDPSFAPAFELAATVYEKSGDPGKAEEALRKAVGLAPSRAAPRERLGELLDQQPGREEEASAAWREAERAGSREALFHLAQAAAREGRSGEALALYRRYLEEIPDGLHAEEARRAVDGAAVRVRILRAALVVAGLLLVIGGAAFIGVRRSGLTLGEWLARDPVPAPDLVPIVGRLRHEAFKHGGLLLREAADRLEAETESSSGTAALLDARLFGDADGSRGLLAEANEALSRLVAVARARGIRLNIRHKDPLLSPVAGALSSLARTRKDLRRLVRTPVLVSARRRHALAESLRSAAAVLNPATGQHLGRLLDEASSTPVTFANFGTLLGEVAGERHAPPPVLFPLGLLANGEPTPRVRMGRSDWDTVWRNLLANSLGATRLGLLGEERRDAVTGQLLLRVVLLDDDPRPLTIEMIRGRAAEQGLGVVADLVRRHDGLIDVATPPETGGYTKGIMVEVPAVEREA